MRSFKSSFKMVARSVGYRLGKRSISSRSEVMPDFAELFMPEYAADAEAGYDEGQAFMRAKYEGRYVDTFYQGRIHP